MFTLCWVQLPVPACARPACLHPAGVLVFESSAFVAETRHTWSKANMFIIMSAATGLARSGLLVGSSRAIGSTGNARQRLTAREQRCLGDDFALE
jgi:hypothetical protein